MKIIYGILIAINFALALITIGGYLSVYVPPKALPFIAFAGLIIPYLIIANILAVLFWSILGKKYFWVSTLILIIGLPWISKLIQIQSPRLQQNEDDIKLVSFNVQNFHSMINASQKNQSEALLSPWTKEIRTFNGIDILCIQEGQHTDQYALPLTDHLVHQVACHSRSNKIFTSYPILKSDCILKNKNNVNSILFADLLINNNDTLRVYNIHLQSNRVSGIANQMLKEKDQNKNIDRTKTAVRQYIETAAIRAQQMETVLEHISNSPYPVILCGDFNEGPQSYVYHQATSVLKDAFLAKGSGFSATYRGFPPFLRIDHVLYDRDIEIQNYKVPKINLSDHYPVLVSFTMHE